MAAGALDKNSVQHHHDGAKFMPFRVVRLEVERLVGTCLFYLGVPGFGVGGSVHLSLVLVGF